MPLDNTGTAKCANRNRPVRGARKFRARKDIGRAQKRGAARI
jgi:hypothetical protein